MNYEPKKLSDFNPSLVTYSYSESGFKHNFSKEYQIILCDEENSISIKNNISLNYCIVYECEVIWSNQNIDSNLHRLGLDKNTISSDTNKYKTFYAIIFKIDNPSYVLTKNGTYHLKWKENSFIKPILLRSNRIEEFYFISTLLFGPEFIIEFDNKSRLLPSTTGDLVGANGWESIDELFLVANICSNWVVLRNAEFLPDNFWENDKDIDVLCDNIELLSRVFNATKRANGISCYKTKIQNKYVDIDMRFLGDDYYDSCWGKNMIETRVYRQNVPLLNNENYFFSLFYHSKIHKKNIKPIYIKRLIDIARQLGFDLTEKEIANDTLSSEIIDDYLYTKNYKFTYPYDISCYLNLNMNVIKRLNNIKTAHYTPYDKDVINLRALIAIRKLKNACRKLVRGL